MSNIQMISLLLAGVNILACLTYVGICFAGVKRTRKPFKVKGKTITVKDVLMMKLN